MYRIDFNGIIHSFEIIPFSIILFAFLLMSFSWVIYALNWKLLLSSIPFIKLQKFTLISGYYSLILPGMIAGDISRIYILGKEGRDYENIAVSVLIHRISGIIGLFIIGLGGIIFSIHKIPLSVIIIFIVGFILGLALFFLIPFDFICRFLNRLRNRYIKLGKIISSLEKIINIWKIYSRKTLLLFYSLAIGIFYQIINVLILFILAQTIGIAISYTDWCWIFTLLSFALFLPISIGGIGIREVSLVGLLSLFQVPSEKAVALSLFLFGLQSIFALIGGFLEWTRKKTLTSNSLSS